jgi:hypothetical protein
MVASMMDWTPVLFALICSIAILLIIFEPWKKDDEEMPSDIQSLSDCLDEKTDLRIALDKAAIDFVWTILRDCPHDFEGHNLPRIEAYMVKRWMRNPDARR